MRARIHLIGWTICILATVLTGCSSTRGTSAETMPTMEPDGFYQFLFEDDGESVTGSATITGTPGAYTGTIQIDDGRPEVRVSSAATSGNLLIVTADIPGAVLMMRVRFEGDSFAGDWVMGRSAGPIKGTRSAVAP